MSKMETIKIGSKRWIVQNQIMNNWSWAGEVIATCSGSHSEVKEDCLKYVGNKDIQFYIFKVWDGFKRNYLYMSRVVKGYDNKYGAFYIPNKKKPVEEYENTAADDYLDYLSDQW